MTDWGDGEYERTARAIEPAAVALVDRVDPQPGERVLDVACGTGNAALVAARRGARVLGLDLSERLVAVARERALGAGVDAEFRVGDALALPVADGEFDVVLSVFGVIFADAGPAAAELMRVVRPGGRVALSTWVPDGPLHRISELVREASGAPPRPATWSDDAYVRAVFAAHEVHVEEHGMALTGATPEEWLAEQFDHHPMYRGAAGALEKAGRLDAVRAAARDTLAAANEDPGAFRATSRYRIVTVVRAA